MYSPSYVDLSFNRSLVSFRFKCKKQVFILKNVCEVSKVSFYTPKIVFVWLYKANQFMNTLEPIIHCK